MAGKAKKPFPMKGKAKVTKVPYPGATRGNNPMAGAADMAMKQKRGKRGK